MAAWPSQPGLIKKGDGLLPAKTSAFGAHYLAKFLAAHELRRQFTRFAAGGLAVAVVSVGVYWLLAVPLGVAPLLANLAQYLTNVSLGFVVQRNWAFKGSTSAGRGAATRYLCVSLLALAANTVWTYILTSVLHWPAWTPIIPMVFVTPAMTFVINRTWVF